nr:integrase, catalytic region, zinc finger, CCHC-type, peptidase aspartic, catalytic [Tanacetum cinerariifolium]
MVKHFSNFEVQYLNLQLKYQHLKKNLGNNNSLPAQDGPDFDSVFEIKKIKAFIQRKDNTVRKLRTQLSQLQETRSEAGCTLDFRALDFQITQLTEKVSVLQEKNKLFRVKNAKVKQHYKELYDSIKITCAKHINQTTALLIKNENLKVKINVKLKCITIDFVTPKVLAPGMYAIDVEPIPSRLRNNREVHRDYLKHLKESVATLREIVEEAKVERPLDRSVASACLYTKHSQELLEYVIGTCPKDFNKQDKKQATTLLNSKKQVTFADQCETSNTNTQKHVEQQITQKTNVLVLSSTGVDSCTDASGSKTRSNTKKNKISPAKSVNKKIVVQIVLWYLDSGCSKHMTGDRSWLRNFVKKFIRIVRFKNDHFGAIMGYEDYVIGDSVIFRAEAVATACYTQNRSLIHTRHNKTPYERVHNKKPDLTFLCVFGPLCYPTNDSEDLGKLQPTTDIGISLVMHQEGRVIESTTKEPDVSWKLFTSNLTSFVSQ